MIDVKNASGQSLSPNGLLAYGVPTWEIAVPEIMILNMMLPPLCSN